MTLDKARRNWKVTAAVLTALVIILLLLWPKIRDALGDLIFGDVVLNVPTPGDAEYPDLFITVNYPPTSPGEPGSTCGCEGHGADAINDAMQYFINGMMGIQDRYLADIYASRPQWADQYWNNSLGYALSQGVAGTFGR